MSALLEKLYFRCLGCGHWLATAASREALARCEACREPNLTEADLAGWSAQ